MLHANDFALVFYKYGKCGRELSVGGIFLHFCFSEPKTLSGFALFLTGLFCLAEKLSFSSCNPLKFTFSGKSQKLTNFIILIHTIFLKEILMIF